jgi:hypothetical protein
MDPRVREDDFALASFRAVNPTLQQEDERDPESITMIWVIIVILNLIQDPSALTLILTSNGLRL